MTTVYLLHEINGPLQVLEVLGSQAPPNINIPAAPQFPTHWNAAEFDFQQPITPNYIRYEKAFIAHGKWVYTPEGLLSGV